MGEHSPARPLSVYTGSKILAEPFSAFSLGFDLWSCLLTGSSGKHLMLIVVKMNIKEDDVDDEENMRLVMEWLRLK